MKKPSSDFNAEEHQVFRQIKGDKDIQVLHADKGNATVAMNAVDYDTKIHNLLDDTESYSRATQRVPQKGTFYRSVCEMKTKSARHNKTEYGHLKDQVSQPFSTEE